VAAWSGVGNAICVPQAVEVLAALLEVIDDPELLE
jgi:hypothetical protein